MSELKVIAGAAWVPWFCNNNRPVLPNAKSLSIVAAPAVSNLPNEPVEVAEPLTPPTLSMVKAEPVTNREPVILWVSSRLLPNIVEPSSNNTELVIVWTLYCKAVIVPSVVILPVLKIEPVTINEPVIGKEPVTSEIADVTYSICVPSWLTLIKLPALEPFIPGNPLPTEKCALPETNESK